MKHFLALTIALFFAAPVLAAEGDEGVDAMLRDLVAWLPGEFSSEAQTNEDKKNNVAEELVHGWVYRSFNLIDAPDVGDHVIISTVRYGGRDGQFDKGEFQVWTLEAHQENGAVKMSPRSFLDPEKYIPLSGDAANFTGLKPSDLAPQKGAAGCTLYWQRTDKGLRGSTEFQPCKALSTTLNSELAWEWSFDLSETEMWINYAGRNADGQIVSGRPDQLPWRLDRVN